MILFTILAIIVLVLVVAAALALGVGGAALAIVFGDLIVFGVIIVGIIRWMKKRKK